MEIKKACPFNVDGACVLARIYRSLENENKLDSTPLKKYGYPLLSSFGQAVADNGTRVYRFPCFLGVPKLSVDADECQYSRLAKTFFEAAG